MTVALDPDLAGVSPIYRGRLQPIGQIGSLVRIPQGLVDLIGAVTLVGISELAEPQPPLEAITVGERWLQVQLLGEIDGLGKFDRGVTAWPALDDPVHFATPENLDSVFPAPSEERLFFGRLSAAPTIPVSLDAGRLVIRHAAIVGSTGSGKTSAVASMLQGFIKGGWHSANVVVIDPHGEYANAIGSTGSVRSVLGEGKTELRVPFWALTATQILWALTGVAKGSASVRFGELVGEARKSFARQAEWLDLDPVAVTADTPVPFDIEWVWYQLDWENRAICDAKKDPLTARVQDWGSPAELRPAVFEPHGPAGAPPHQYERYGGYGSTPQLLRLGLRDPQKRFLLSPRGSATGSDPLNEVMHEWLGDSKPISVLDFSGVPAEAADLAIGVVTNLLFEVAVRSRTHGIGRPLPVLLVLEEAHRYLGEGAEEFTRQAVNRVAREGRKYGMGLMMVTQRPSELPDTALAQCGTVIALRLTNGTDQARVRSALPDSVAGLADILPALRTGEAVVCGEAIVLPARTLIEEPDPWPDAADPSLAPWRGEGVVPDLEPPISAWRGTYDTAESSATEGGSGGS